MELIEKTDLMQQKAEELRLAGKVLGLVPTTGFFHKAIEELVRSHPHTQIDYVTLCDPVTLDDMDTLRNETLLALAVRVGKTRLIDNCVLGKGEKQ
jgi:pantothenate synthetase